VNGLLPAIGPSGKAGSYSRAGTLHFTTTHSGQRGHTSSPSTQNHLRQDPLLLSVQGSRRLMIPTSTSCYIKTILHLTEKLNGRSRVRIQTSFDFFLIYLILAKRSRRVRLTSPPSLSQLSRKCGILDVGLHGLLQG
jgi:hypothetical protein